MVEEADSVLLEIEVSFIRSVLYREVPLQFMKEPHLRIIYRKQFSAVQVSCVNAMSFRIALKQPIYILHYINIL